MRKFIVAALLATAAISYPGATDVRASTTCANSEHFHKTSSHYVSSWRFVQNPIASWHWKWYNTIFGTTGDQGDITCYGAPPA